MVLVLGPNNPPDSCFVMNDEGDLPTCTYSNGEWHRSYDNPGMDDGAPIGGFVVLFFLALIVGIGFTVWKVSTARRMARDSGMDVGDATAMTLLTDEGFEATYMASNLRGQTTPPPAGSSGAARLRELQGLLDDGLITQAEHDERRKAIIDSL